MIFFYFNKYIGGYPPFLHRFFDKIFPFFSFCFPCFDKNKSPVVNYGYYSMEERRMKAENTNSQSVSQKQALRILCRFLSVRFSYRFLLLLLFATGIILTATGNTLFAPYGISLLCLILPSFLNDTVEARTKKENSDFPLSSLYKRYHYSPITYSCYRISLYLGMLLLPVWHKIQSPELSLFGISLPLLYLALFLALVPVLGYGLYFFFHHKLMNGTL